MMRVRAQELCSGGAVQQFLILDASQSLRAMIRFPTEIPRSCGHVSRNPNLELDGHMCRDPCFEYGIVSVRERNLSYAWPGDQGFTFPLFPHSFLSEILRSPELPPSLIGEDPRGSLYLC